MDVNIHGDGIRISEELDRYTRSKINRLDRYLPNIAHIRVELAIIRTHRGADLAIAQITVQHARGAILRAEERMDIENRDTIRLAINKAVDKLHRQIDRRRTDGRGIVDARKREAVFLLKLLHPVQITAGMGRDVSAGDARADKRLNRTRALQARIRPDTINRVSTFTLNHRRHDLTAIGRAPARILRVDDFNTRELRKHFTCRLKAELGGPESASDAPKSENA